MENIAILKIDKDCIVSQEWLLRWKRLVVIPTCKRFGLKVECIKTYSSSGKGKGFHAVISVTGKHLTSERINELQFYLGDDSQRVSMNRARIKAGLEEWNKLFITPNMNPEAEKPRSFLERVRRLFR